MDARLDSRSIPPSDVAVAVATTTPRQTPTPPRATRFGELLSSTVVRSAESVMRTLPGSPVMAVAVRNATGTAALGVPANMLQAPLGGGGGAGAATAPLAGTSPMGPLATPGSSSPPDASNGTAAAGGIESSLQQSQDMNLYYLQIQEAVNAQNRSYTTLSNVMKAQHDTVKNAIGNIR
jgi:hypothetical protein